MVVGELAFSLGEDVLGLAAGALGAGQLLVDGDLLRNDRLPGPSLLWRHEHDSS